jgi:hypothetical protein
MNPPHFAGIAHSAAFARLAPLGRRENMPDDLPIDLVRRRERGDRRDSRRAFVETPEQIPQGRGAGADHARSLFYCPDEPRILFRRTVEGLHIIAIVLSWRFLIRWYGARPSTSPGWKPRSRQQAITAANSIE